MGVKKNRARICGCAKRHDVPTVTCFSGLASLLPVQAHYLLPGFKLSLQNITGWWETTVLNTTVRVVDEWVFLSNCIFPTFNLMSNSCCHNDAGRPSISLSALHCGQPACLTFQQKSSSNGGRLTIQTEFYSDCGSWATWLLSSPQNSDRGGGKRTSMQLFPWT